MITRLYKLTRVRKEDRIPKLERFRDSLIDEVNTIESQGDKLYSSAMKDLMTNEKDLLKVIKWKDVYDQLERTINDCESAVNIIVGIVIKNT